MDILLSIVFLLMLFAVSAFICSTTTLTYEDEHCIKNEYKGKRDKE